MSSPLGKYTELAATIIAIMVIASTIASHLLQLAGTQFIDDLALLAMGAIFGAKSAANGYAGAAMAANLRLDAIGAPSAGSAVATPPPPPPAGG